MATPYPDIRPYNKQSIEVPGTRRTGQTGHYQNAIWGLVKHNDRPLKTLLDAFNLGLSLSKDKPFLGRRPVISTNPLKYADHYVWETYAQINERKQFVGSILEHLFKDGFLGGQGEYQTVGLWMPNRPEWQIVDLATHSYNKVSVSLYDTLGKDSIEYIIRHAYLTIVFTTVDHVPQLLTMSRRILMLKMIVIVGLVQDETKSVLRTWAKNVNIEIYDFSEFEEMGSTRRLDVIPPRSDQLATICYTSGTTNNPKGVLLTHRNLMAGSDAFLHGVDDHRYWRLLSYLPLAHIYERIAEIDIMKLGGCIGYSSGDPLRLLEDAKILKPTYFPTVPRVLNKVYQAAMLAGQAPTLKGYLFRAALDVKLNNLRKTGEVTHAFWDKLVFKKIQDVLGGNVHTITIGSAPVSIESMDFFKVAFACDVLEGDLIPILYGMTESCAASTSAWPSDPTSSGTMGAVKSSSEVKLVDVPHLGYTVNDKPYPRGEICIRGDNCFKSYYKDDEATRDAIDDEGWLHSGDVGAIDGYGRFIFIDRVKNIMKLSQGEFVALDKIQNIYSACPLIMQLYVHGDPLREHLVAIVMPELEQFAIFVSRFYNESVSAGDLSRLASASKEQQVLEAFLREMDKEARNEKLKGFERIRNIYISLEPFSVENGLLTPTLKIRRRDAYAKYKHELEQLYSKTLLSDRSVPSKL